MKWLPFSGRNKKKSDFDGKIPGNKGIVSGVGLDIDFIFNESNTTSMRQLMFNSKGELTVGRATYVDIPIENEEISREHGKFVYTQGRCFYVDESSNGTYVENVDHVDGKVKEGNIKKIKDDKVEVSDGSKLHFVENNGKYLYTILINGVKVEK